MLSTCYTTQRTNIFREPLYCLPAPVSTYRGLKEMSGGSSMVSILNNDDHPSFAIRSNARLGRPCSSPPFYPQQTEQQLPPINDHQSTRPHASSESPTASPREAVRSFAPVTDSVQPISPGSSDGSAYDYLTSQPSSSSAYPPYARQDVRREPYRHPSRGPAAPRTPPEVRSSTANEAKSTPSTGTRGGRKSKYPCPYAVSHGCSATFTTSGHAARHGKKHTGEKSVHCPICNKAFTRKDNMKQHIRTHRTHSDDLRSTSEAEGETRWGMGRPESSYASSTRSRTVSQSTDASILAPPSSGPAHPS